MHFVFLTKFLKMKKVILFFGLLLTITSCSSGGDNPVDQGSDYDRTALLTNWADNIIVPAYTNYQSKVETLITNTNNFNASPTVENLKTLRTSWLEAYAAYQYVAIYSFGKAEAVNLKECTNAYPTNATGIETNILSGTYNLTLLSQYDKQGFPALDYLINGLANSDEAIVAFYKTNANATNYKNYLVAVNTRLKTNIDLIVTDWNSGYRNTYVSNNGTSVSSSVNITTNNFVKNLEKDVRSGKVGIPAGVFSNGAKFPEKVEAFYKNNVSKDLLNIGVHASQDFFNGKHIKDPASGPSLKSYLDYVNAVRDGKKLSDIINTQYTIIFNTNNTLDDSFSNQINADNSKMLTDYDALQQNVIYTKLDMMQALNITIDYVDGDGD